MANHRNSLQRTEVGPIEKIKLYGLRVSYYTGKMEAYLRYKGIEHDFVTDMPVPKVIMRAVIRRRQLGKYVKKDGVSNDTWDHVESIYLKTLDRQEVVFSQRDFLLGDKPSVADFGLFASMFRHFSQDSTASDIMRLQAPGVFAWQARLWNARWNSASRWLDTIPEDLAPILKDAGEAYLPYLNDNARAWQQTQERFNPATQGVQYRDVPVSQYRVWCLEELQRKARAVPEMDQDRLKAILDSVNCWAPLFEFKEPASGYDDSDLPFRAGKVHSDHDCID